MSLSTLTVALLASSPTIAGDPPPTVPVVAVMPATTGNVPAATGMPKNGDVAPAPSTQPAPTSASPPVPGSVGPTVPQAPVPTTPPPTTATDIVVTARTASPGDPLEGINASTFAASEAVDKALIAPVALAYKSVLPRPVRSGLRNFLNNLKEPIVALNFLLQLKPGKAAETLARFAINSTIGAAGLFDVAALPTINLPRRRNGFGDTLGYYGVGPGPFLFLPLTGPTTLRDILGGTVDGLLLPVAVGKPFNQLTYTVPTGLVRGLDRRVESDAELTRLRQGPSPYQAVRELYLKKRHDEIEALHGRGPKPATPVAPATAPTP